MPYSKIPLKERVEVFKVSVCNHIVLMHIYMYIG